MLELFIKYFSTYNIYPQVTPCRFDTVGVFLFSSRAGDASLRSTRVPQQTATERHVFRRDGGYNARLPTEMRFLTDRPTNSVVVTAYARELMATT